MGQTSLHVMVGKGECFLELRLDHVKGSQPGVALEGVLPK